MEKDDVVKVYKDHTTVAWLTEAFKVEVNDKAEEVGDEQHWYSVTLGWGIAKGLSVEDAHSFANYIRYDTDLG